MKRIALIVLSCVLGAASAGFAQETALTGRVTDAQGAGVPGADVRLAREDATVTRTAVSDGTGAYRIDEVPSGVFVVEVGKPGFRRRTEVVTVAADADATLDIQLEVAGIDDSVVVTAAGVPQVTQETSRAITIIEAQDIQARNENALSEIVRFTPGVQVRNSGGPGQATSMRIRGLRSDAAAVLVDGMRFRDASTIQADATSFLSTLHFVAADRVEVLRGSGSSLYGTNAVGGVVNIVTRPGGGAFRGEGQVEGGSLGHVRARGSAGGGALNNRLRYSVGVLQFNLLDGLDGNDSTRSTGAHGLMHYDVTQTANVMVRVLASNDRVQTNTSPTASGVPAANIPQAIIVNAVPVTPEQIALSNRGLPFQIGQATYIPGRDDPDSMRTSAFHTTALRFRHSAWQAVSWQASYQHVYTRRIFTNGVLGRGFQPAAESFSHIVGGIDTADVRAFLAPRSWVNLTAGYEFERERFHDRQDNNLPAPRRTQTETEIRQDGNAAFASAQFALVDRLLQLSVSGRVQTFSLSNPRLIAVGTTSPYDGVVVVSPPSALTGDVSAAYFLAASDTKLRIHGGNAFRAPAMYERFGGGFDTDPITGRVGFTPYGDPRLEPDRYRTIDAGVDQYLFRSRLLVSATAFYNQVTSLTAFNSAGGIRPDTDPYGRSLGYLNSSGGFSRGVEVAIEARPASSLRLSGGYTYTRSETAEDITVPGFFLVPAVFAHMVTFVVTNRWNNRLDTTFDLFHGGATYGSLFAAGRPRAYKYPGFTKAAVVAGYRLVNHARAPLRAYVKVDNLFDQTYYEIGWRNLGRTAIAGLSVGF
ncbi:MAG: TonB-dependent receptor [Vicinamibacterales bacterium]